MKKNTLVWCKTKEQVLATLKVAEEMGYRFSTNFADCAWNCYGNSTVMNLRSDSRIVTYCYKEWYERHTEYGKIITAEKFLGIKPILITQSGRLTIAEDKNTGEKGIASCSPDDTYDFHTGALIAVARLIAKSEKGITKDAETVLRQLLGDDVNNDAPAEEEPTAKFKIGDLVTLKDGLKVGKVYGGLTLSEGMYGRGHNKPLKVLEVSRGETFSCAPVGGGLAYWYSKEMLEPWDENKIREGDIVEVVNTGANYPCYTEWIYEYITDTTLARRFGYDNNPKKLERYEVVKIASHGIKDEMLAYIKPCFDSIGGCYIVGVRGLKRVAK